MFNFLKKILLCDEKGNILMFVIVFGAISFTVMILGLSGYAISENRASRHKLNREEALQIAEAGITYYRWHLAHNKTDYWDGNSSSTPGPYVHDYRDKDGNITGQFSLNIIPPPTGSTVVIIESTGWTHKQPDSKRTLRARVGFPSLADYAILQNANVYVTGQISGKLHANGGIRFEGTANAPISSSMTTYTCPSIHGCSGVKNGIWGGGGPTSYWQFSVPAKDFTSVTAKLAEIRSAAFSEGGGSWPFLSSSGNLGWKLRFINDGSIGVSKVLTCTPYRATDRNPDTGVSFTVNPIPCLDAATFGPEAIYSMSSSTYIFVDDNLWVHGVVKGRATIGVGTGKFVVLHDNLTYLAKDGTHVLGLIADQNIFLPRNSPNNLNIDAALLSQNGTFKRYNYASWAGPLKNDFVLFGSRILNKVGGISWFSGSTLVSGYQTQTYTYDTNLTYSPPAGFPVGSIYNLISWEEVN